jgi:hypothetical protein
VSGASQCVANDTMPCFGLRIQLPDDGRPAHDALSPVLGGVGGSSPSCATSPGAKRARIVVDAALSPVRRCLQTRRRQSLRPQAHTHRVAREHSWPRSQAQRVHDGLEAASALAAVYLAVAWPTAGDRRDAAARREGGGRGGVAAACGSNGDTLARRLAAAFSAAASAQLPPSPTPWLTERLREATTEPRDSGHGHA